MVIAALTLDLEIPECNSLKFKRRVLRSLLDRIRRDYNVSAAEVDQQNAWQRARLGVVCVSTDVGYAHGLLEKVVRMVESSRLDVVLSDYAIEML